MWAFRKVEPNTEVSGLTYRLTDERYAVEVVGKLNRGEPPSVGGYPQRLFADTTSYSFTVWLVYEIPSNEFGEVAP